MRKVLLALLVISLAFYSVSCKKDEKVPTKQTAPVSDEAPTDEEIPMPVFPDKDYSDSKFHIYIGTNSFFGNFIAKEETGALINDAIFARDLYIEDKYGLKIEYTKGGGSTGGEITTTTKTISNFIQAGDDTYDVFVHVQHAGMPSLIMEDMFIDWNDLPYVDLEKPWWYQNIRRDLCFGDSVYLMTGDLALYVQRTECLLFNKNMFDELGLDYPYDLVKDMKWTYDEFLTLCQLAKKDLNGDTEIKYEDDRIGYSGWTWEMCPALYIGMGGRTIGKDDSGMPVLAMNNERTVKILDNIVNLFSEKGVGWCNEVLEPYYNLSTGDAFKNGRVMFQDSLIGSVTGFREMENDFGVIPYPMLDVEQNEYFSRSPNFSPLMYIPITNKDLEKTSILLEDMTSYSYKNITPVLFDTVITLKGVRDVESEEMLPLIRDSSRFWYEGFMSAGTINGYVQKGNNTFSSEYASKESKYLDAIAKMEEFYTK